MAGTPANYIDSSELSIATAFLQQNEDLVWSIEWQNEAAKSLWGDYDINDDLPLKLSLMDICGSSTPKSFFHKLHSNIQFYHFLVSPLNDGLLAQFFLEEQSKDHESVNQDNSTFELVLEASKIGILDVDLESNRIHYSDKVYELCSLDYAELGTHFDTFLSLIHPQDLDAFNEAFDAHLELSWPFEVEFRIRTRMETYVWLSSKGKKVYEKGEDQPSRFVATLEDISERKRYERMVKSREELIAQIIDSVPISIYVKDEKGAYRFFSSQAARDAGVDQKAVIGKTDYEIFPIAKARKLVAHDSEVTKTGLTSVVEERVSSEDPTLSDKWYLKGKGPIRIGYEDKVHTWLLGFSVDITHQKLVEDKLIQAKDAAEASAKAKSDFLSVMSHEIRTPLNSVIGGAQLLMTENLEEEQQRHVELIQQSGEHLLNLINDILDYSKMDAGKLDLEDHEFDIHDVSRNVLEMNNVNAKKKSIDLVLNFEESVPRYRSGDIARLRQLLLNLLTNAVKFTDKGSVTLSVSQGEAPNAVIFKVIDTGIGIPQESIGKLFSEFTQADASTTRKYGGTGLGLAICRKIVEAMNGQIGILSDYGHGSTFWFEIELEVLTAPIQKKMSHHQRINESSHQGKPLNILVAEDNATNQILIKAILKKLKHEVTIVENGVDAVNEMKASKEYDLILMDMQMPEMDGVEATRKIRQLSTGQSDIPIIALTANASEDAKSEVLDAGMNDFLTKPVDIMALKKLLDFWSEKVQ